MDLDQFKESAAIESECWKELETKYEDYRNQHAYAMPNELAEIIEKIVWQGRYNSMLLRTAGESIGIKYRLHTAYKEDQCGYDQFAPTIEEARQRILNDYFVYVSAGLGEEKVQEIKQALESAQYLTTGDTGLPDKYVCGDNGPVGTLESMTASCTFGDNDEVRWEIIPVYAWQGEQPEGVCP